jgi:hypothetical protein
LSPQKLDGPLLWGWYLSLWQLWATLLLDLPSTWEELRWYLTYQGWQDWIG